MAGIEPDHLHESKRSSKSYKSFEGYKTNFCRCIHFVTIRHNIVSIATRRTITSDDPKQESKDCRYRVQMQDSHYLCISMISHHLIYYDVVSFFVITLYLLLEASSLGGQSYLEFRALHFLTQINIKVCTYSLYE